MLRNKRIWTLFGMLAIFVIVMFLPMSLSKTLRRYTTEALAPVHKLFGSAGDKVSGFGKSVLDRNRLLEENASLKLENAALQRRVKDLEAVEKENLHLSQQLKFVQRQERSLLAANVIARDIAGWWQTVTIDRGSRQGVNTNQAVVTANGLVGKVIDTTSSTANILLISDPSCKVSVRLESEESTGVLSGGGVSFRGKIRCRLSLLQTDIKVSKEDPIITTGMGGIFPGGIEVGYIDDVELDKSGLFQRATVIPAVDLQGLSTVFVILGGTR